MKTLIVRETAEQLLDVNTRNFAMRVKKETGLETELVVSAETQPGGASEAPQQIFVNCDLTTKQGTKRTSHFGGGYNLHMLFSTNDPLARALTRGYRMGRDDSGVFPAALRSDDEGLLEHFWDSADGEAYLTKLLELPPELVEELRATPAGDRAALVRQRMPYIQNNWDATYQAALDALQAVADA